MRILQEHVTMAAISLQQEVVPPRCSTTTKEEQGQQPENNQYILYPQRWFTLGSFAILTCSSAWIWITWAPLAIQLTTFWDVPVSAVDDLSGIYLFVFAPGSFMSLYFVINRLGLRKGIIYAGILNLLGAWFRYKYFHNYRMVYVGTFACAVAQTITMPSPPLISGNWFGEKERATSTAIGVLANQLGTAFGLGTTILVDFFVHNADIATTNTTDTTEQQTSSIGYYNEERILDENVLQGYLKFQFVHALLGLVAVIVFVGDFPPTPPSLAASLIIPRSANNESLYQDDEDSNDGEKIAYTKTGNKSRNVDTTSYSMEEDTALLLSMDMTGLPKHNSYTEEGASSSNSSTYHQQRPKPSFGESIQIIFSNTSSILFVIAYGLGLGVYYTIPTFLSQLFPLQSARSIGWLGVCYQLVGVFGSFIAGRIIDVTQGHRKLALSCLIGSCCLLLLSTFFVGNAIPSNDININDGDGSSSSSSYTLFGVQLSSLYPSVPSELSWIFGASFIAVTGTCLSAFNAVGVELGTGMVYPADESVMAGILESSAEFCGFILVTIGGKMASSALYDLQSSSGEKELLLMVASSIAMGVVILVRLRTDMTRPSERNINLEGLK